MKSRVKLVNGPLSGLEVETENPEFIDFLDSKDGKVRRYTRGNFAVFVKEWPDKETRDKEVFGDHTSGPGQLGEDDSS
jgi:hypothetical protein